MEEMKKKAAFNALGIIAVLGGTLGFVIAGLLNVGALVLGVAACYPMAKNLWQAVAAIRSNMPRKLLKLLPKLGFVPDNTEWNQQHTGYRIIGKFYEENFAVDAEEGSPYVVLYDLPWFHVKSTDPEIPRILEAINEVNAKAMNMSVVLTEPREDGIREIFTSCLTVLPAFDQGGYLGTIMCHMIDRKAAFLEAMKRERPYMKQQRSPIGFNAAASTTTHDSAAAPAASNRSDLSN